MKRVLICWEDAYFDGLARCLRRARRARAQDGAVDPALHSVSVLGNGGFAPYLRRTWPVARVRGIPRSGGPMDYVICIADADRAADCCGIALPPPPPALTDAWTDAANQRWTEQLRREADDDREQVFGRFLRWNKESLLIAGHDVPGALAQLSCRDAVNLRRHLAVCDPSPLSLDDGAYVHRYRSPGRCLQDMLKAGKGPALSKGDKRLDDALGEIAEGALAALLARVPDLVGLAELLRDCAQS